MNTSKLRRVPILKEDEENKIFCMEFIEPTFRVSQLTRVVQMWNDGMNIEEIAKKEKRHFLDILLALIHQVYCPPGYDKAKIRVTRKLMQPKPSPLMVPGRQQLKEQRK